MVKKPKKLTPLMVRLPEELHQSLSRRAKSNDNSLNTEIVHRLEHSLHQASDDLLRAIVRHAIGAEPRYIVPADGRKFGFSSEMKILVKSRLAAFVDSIPDAPPSSLSKEEAEQLWAMVRLRQAEIDKKKVK